MTHTPLISVIMPVYNTERFVGEAIESILNQTFTDFELVIIDDGSTDSSREIIQHYAQQDQRIKAYQNEENKGISYTRNKLIELSQTNYIAAQDSDDISLPQRLELSYNYLQNHRDCAVVGWNNIIIDEEWVVVWYRKYSNNIKNIILKKSPLSQPSIMLRKDCFHKVWWYDPHLNYGEDYDLWLKFYAQWYIIHNILADLLHYRIRSWQTKSDKLKETLRNTRYIQKKAIKEYNMKSILSDRVYHLLERLLLLLPNSLILRFFKKIEYK